MIENKKPDIQKISKYLAIIMIVAFSISAAIIFASGGRFFNNDSIKTTVNDTKKSDLSAVTKVVLDTSSEDLNITPISSGAKEISAHLHGYITSTSKYAKPELQVSRSGDTVYIKVEHKTHVTFGFFSSDMQLDVQLPEAYSKAIEIGSTSGDIKFDNLKLSELKIDISSGNTNAQNITADKFEYECTSGDSEIIGLKTNTASFEASSGNINVKDFTGDLTSDTTSGNVHYEYATFNNNVSIEVSSGNTTLALPANAQFNLNAKATSGDVSCDFPITVTNTEKHNSLNGSVGNSTNTVKLNSTSGNINCIKK